MNTVMVGLVIVVVLGTIAGLGMCVASCWHAGKRRRSHRRYLDARTQEYQALHRPASRPVLGRGPR